MYTQYFGFKKPPFSITPDSGCFYTNAVFLDAHATLLDAIDEQLGLNLLTGEPGTGKTTLLKRLTQDLDETIQLVYLQNSNLNLQDLVGCLLDKLGLIEPGQTRWGIDEELKQLQRHLQSLTEQRRSCVLFIDDAQNLPGETLGSLPLLLKAGDNGSQLQVLLSGSQELLLRLNAPELSELSGLVAAHARLRELQISEIPAFIDYQIRFAGSMRSDIFSEPAIREITQTTSGRPSDINKVCDKALEIAYRQGTQVVTREIIRQTSSASWLELEATRSDAAPQRHNLLRRLLDKTAASFSRPKSSWTQHFPAFSGGSLNGLKDRILPLWGFLRQKSRALANSGLHLGRGVFEKTGILLLVAAAKLWKLGTHTSRRVKPVAKAVLPRARQVRQRYSGKLQRRHAWIAGGLALLLAFGGLLVFSPAPDRQELAQTAASAETGQSKAADQPATVVKTQNQTQEASGRRLTRISEMRAEIAQLNLDLKTTISNRDYLKNRVKILTSERDKLKIERSQIQFAHDQLQLTLATTRKQVAKLERDLTASRNVVAIPSEKRETNQLSNPDDEASNAATASSVQNNDIASFARDQQQLLDPSGQAAQTSVAQTGSEPDPGTAAKPNPGPFDVSQSNSVRSDSLNGEPPMDYISDTAAVPASVSSEETPIINGEPQIVAAAPLDPGKGLSAEPVSDNAVPLPPATSGETRPAAAKKRFSNQTVALLLHKARRLYLKDKLTTPADNNAYDVYKQVLEGHPGHPKARAGLEKIASRYMGWAETEAKNGNKTKAIRYYKKALSVLPGNREVAAKIEALESGRPVTAKLEAPAPAKPAATASATGNRQSEVARDRLKTLRVEISERSLLRAVEAGNLEMAGLLIDAGISPDAQNTAKQTALLTAAINGDEAITRLLIARGANVNKTNTMGRSPLIAAAWNGDAALVAILLEGGAKIETTSREGWNALMYAAWNGHHNTVSALLKNGGQVNAVNAQGWTALMNAAWNGHNETVRVLLEHGANPGYETPSGETALLVASQQGHRETALLLD